MSITSILKQRLLNQQIAATHFSKPEELVRWMGGMQAQDYGQAILAIGIRLQGATNEVVENAIKQRKIIRTWLFRGTLHFVSADNVHPFLELLSPKLIKGSATRHRQLKLDEAILKQCRNVLIRSLRDGRELVREEISEALKQKGITASGERLLHILHYAALNKVICLGTKRDKQFTYTLLGEAADANKTFNRTETLAMLALQYYQSHGPATVQDFASWGGFNITDAREGLESIKTSLTEEKINGQSFWGVENNSKIDAKRNDVYLLPGFDEYIMGYKDRVHFLDAAYAKRVISVNGLFAPTIIINGQITGIWKRTVKRDQLQIEITPLKPLNKSENKAVLQAADRYADITGLNVSGIENGKHQ